MEDGQIVAEFVIKGRRNLGERREVSARIIVRKFDVPSGTIHIEIKEDGNDRKKEISIAPFFDGGSIMIPKEYGAIFEGTEIYTKQFSAYDIERMLEDKEKMKTLREAWTILTTKED